MRKTSFTDAEVAQFKREGYIIVRGLLDEAETRALQAWTDEVQGWPETPGKFMKYFEKGLKDGARLLNRIENFAPYHKGFDGVMRHPALLHMLGQLFGSEAVLYKEKINFKLPGGGGFTPHQDAQAGWDVYADFFITALISIDESTIENGCLEMVAGAHDRGLIGEMWKPLTDEQMKGMNFVPVPTKPGDAVFFDSFAPHRSAPNMTSAPRRVLYVTYNRANAGDHRIKYYADKRKSFPPDVEREPGKVYEYKV